MIGKPKAAATEPENATVTALVTLTVVPRVGQSSEEAATEMLGLFTGYLTERDSMFLTDYGITTDQAKQLHAGTLDEEPAWGGYEGPFVLESQVGVVVPQ